MSDTGSGQVGSLGWDEASLREAYSILEQVPSFDAVSRDVDVEQWVRLNLLLDQDLSEKETARRVGLRRSVVAKVNNPRRCLELHDHDSEALRRCLDGQ